MARQMKDSGVEWIGEIPSCWELRPARYAFSEVKEKNAEGTETRALQFKFGKIIVKTNFNAEDDDYVADTITNYTIVEPGTVMINGLNLNYDFKTQRVALVTERGVITSAYLALRPDEQLIDAEYATYLFKGYESKMALHNMGAGIRLTLGYREFKNQPVLFPTLCEQRRIVAFLDRRCAEIDAVIERTKATIEEYKKLKQAVITEAVTKGVRGERKMKDSGIEWLGSIPDAWDCTKLKQVWVSVDSGVSVNAADYPTENDTQYGVLKTSCVSKFVFLANEHKQVDAEEYARVACPVKKDTIIVSRMNTPDLVGACGYVDADYPNLFLPDRLWQISFFPEVSAKFVWYYLNNQMVRAYISSLSTGTSSSMQNISKPQFGGITLAVPPTIEQDEIVHYLDEKCAALDTLISKKTALLTELETYKKSLIYEYVTGKKEVPACP